MNSAQRVIVFAAALVIGRAPSSLAQTGAAQALLDQLRHCAAAGDGVQRLACYDQLAAQVPAAADARADSPSKTVSLAGTSAAAAAAAPAAAASSPAAASSATASSAEFGVNAGPLQARQQASKPRAMTAVVTKISVRPRGELVMTLDNGQVWVQNEAAAYFPLKPGDKVEISVGLLDSYVLWAPFRRSSKVTRIN